MKIKVMKFGGTSVATVEARHQSAMRVISAKEQGFSPVAVVSAIGRKGAPYATDTLLNLLREIDETIEPDAREIDLMISCGEIFSAVIFAHTLKSLGHAAKAFRGGQAGIQTDGVFGNARIVAIQPKAILRCLSDRSIPVVCGFQGIFSNDGFTNEVTTLGRGGSDTTAAALGASLRADCVEIFTDVEGVKTADPDFVKNAPTLRTVSYEEVAEIAHLGAKVLHPRAAEIAMRHDIPLWVKSTFSEDIGTQVVQHQAPQPDRVTGVTHSGKLVYLQFNFMAAQDEHRIALESSIYDMMAKYAVNLYMMNLSPAGIGFAVPRDQFPVVLDLLDGLVLPMEGDRRSIYLIQVGEKPSLEAETQLTLLSPLGEVTVLPIQLTEGCTMVSLIGGSFLKQPGVFYRVLSMLHEHQVSVLQTSDSDLSLSCLIPESETERSVRLLHDSFGLGSAG